MNELINIISEVIEVESVAKWELDKFFKARMQQQLEKQEIEYDIIKAVLATKSLNFVQIIENAQLMQAFKIAQPALYRVTVEALTRVVNLGANIEMLDFDVDMSQTESEKDLMNSILTIETIQPSQLLESFKSMVSVIEAYFENNMVNDSDETIKLNRLATLGKLSQSILLLVDPRELISKF